MPGNLNDTLLVPDYLRNNYVELMDWFDKEWTPWFTALMPKAVGEGRGSHKHWRRDRAADPQGMAKYYGEDEAIEPMNAPSIRPWSFMTRKLGNAFTRKKNWFTADFAEGVIEKAHAEMMENLTKWLNRSIEYTLVQFAKGDAENMGEFTDQDTNRQAQINLLSGTFRGVADANLGGTAWSDFTGGTPAVFEDLAYLKERFSFISQKEAEYMLHGRKTAYFLEMNDDLLDRLIRLVDTTQGVLGTHLMGLKLIKVLGQTFKEQIGVNTALEGMPGKGDYLEMDWDNLNKNDMMVETIGNDVYEWSIIGAGDIGAVKCAWIDEDHEAQRGSPTDIFIEQWEDRNPKRIWTTAQLEICPEIRDYALVMLVQGVAKQ